MNQRALAAPFSLVAAMFVLVGCESMNSVDDTADAAAAATEPQPNVAEPTETPADPPAVEVPAP